MSTDFYLELEQFTQKIAISACDQISEQRKEFTAHSCSIPFSVKTSVVDPVTIVDQAAEQHIRQQILAVRPKDGFLGEEYGYTPHRTDIDWIIDPIDGTVNFLYGLPNYSVSIAAAEKGTVVVAVVVDIVHRILYSYALGGTSTRTDLSTGITSPNIPSLADNLEISLLGTGFSYDKDLRNFQGQVLAPIIPQVRDIRRLGSAALDLCLVACGALDIYYEYGLKPWDFAAGAAIAEHAGALVRTPKLIDYLQNQSSGPSGRQCLVWAIAPKLAQSWDSIELPLG